MQYKTKLLGIFAEMDRDNNGYLTLDEVKAGFRNYRQKNPEEDSFNDEEVEIFFSVADEDGDGKVSYQEFVDSLIQQ